MFKKFNLLIFCLFSLPSWALEPSRNFDQELKRFGVSFKGAEQFKVIKSQGRQARATSFFNIIAEKGKIHLDLEVTMPIPANEVSSMIDTQVELIEKLYGPQFTPYQGAVTNITTCAENSKPQKKTINVLGRPTTVLLVNATERHALGACDKNDIKLKATIAFVYNTNTSAFMNFRIFSPIAKFSEKEIIKFLENFKSQ